MEEKSRYLPGLRAWVGYRNTVVYYDRQDRAAGEGKLSFMSRIKYAMDAITSFSYKPLRLSFALFCFSTCVAGLMAFFMLLSKSSVDTAGLLSQPQCSLSRFVASLFGGAGRISWACLRRGA